MMSAATVEAAAAMTAVEATMESAATAAPTAMPEGIGEPKATDIGAIIALTIIVSRIAAIFRIVVAVSRVVARVAAITGSVAAVIATRHTDTDAHGDMRVCWCSCCERHAQRRTCQHKRADCILAEAFHCSNPLFISTHS